MEESRSPRDDGSTRSPCSLLPSGLPHLVPRAACTAVAVARLAGDSGCRTQEGCLCSAWTWLVWLAHTPHAHLPCPSHAASTSSCSTRLQPPARRSPKRCKEAIDQGLALFQEKKIAQAIDMFNLALELPGNGAYRLPGSPREYRCVLAQAGVGVGVGWGSGGREAIEATPCRVQTMTGQLRRSWRGKGSTTWRVKEHRACVYVCAWVCLPAACPQLPERRRGACRPVQPGLLLRAAGPAGQRPDLPGRRAGDRWADGPWARGVAVRGGGASTLGLGDGRNIDGAAGGCGCGFWRRDRARVGDVACSGLAWGDEAGG